MPYLLPLLVYLFLLVTFSPVYGQSYQLTSLTPLSESLRESSGLLYREGRLITHNDSGDGPRLYEVDTLTGNVLREVYVTNATNVDWEDITADTDYLYLADIGNNFGTRTDLRIYRLPWVDYLTADTVFAEHIDYSYADQLDFTSSQFSTPYDAEALVAIEDSLYVFTKDWSMLRTKVYSLPKTPGTYAATAVDSFAVSGLLTGVDISPAGDRLLFSAYNPAEALVLTLSNFSPPLFSQGQLDHWLPALPGSFKTEGIGWCDDRFAFLSTEILNGQPAALYRIDTDFVDAVEEITEAVTLRVFPQPARNYLRVEGGLIKELRLYTLTGELMAQKEGVELDTSRLPRGIYFLWIRTETAVKGKKILLF